MNNGKLTLEIAIREALLAALPETERYDLLSNEEKMRDYFEAKIMAISAALVRNLNAEERRKVLSLRGMNDGQA